jgi:hypothetical protein
LKLVIGVVFQASVQFTAVGSGVLNEVSPLNCHALEKVGLIAEVPSFAPAGKDVRAEQFFQVSVKLRQFTA